MVGRQVASVWHSLTSGTIEKWEPLGAGGCDVLVRREDGSLCWYGSSDLQPIDGKGPLPSRHEAQEAARKETLASLQAIQAQHVADFGKPWPGAEFGKSIIGAAINGAIKSLV
jgi:hypothetical protein